MHKLAPTLHTTRPENPITNWRGEQEAKLELGATGLETLVPSLYNQRRHLGGLGGRRPQGKRKKEKIERKKEKREKKRKKREKERREL